MHCVSMAKRGFDYKNLENANNWDFTHDLTKNDPMGYSVINVALNELWWMHIISGVLLLGSLISIKRKTGTVFTLGSVFRIITIPIYLAVLFRAE